MKPQLVLFVHQKEHPDDCLCGRPCGIFSAAEYHELTHGRLPAKPRGRMGFNPRAFGVGLLIPLPFVYVNFWCQGAPWLFFTNFLPFIVLAYFSGLLAGRWIELKASQGTP